MSLRAFACTRATLRATTRHHLLHRSYSTTGRVAPKPFSSIPGPRIIPEEGGTLYDFKKRFESTGSALAASNSYQREFGDVVRLDMGGDAQVWVFDPDEIVAAFRRESTEKGETPAQSVPFFSRYLEEEHGIHSPFFGPSNEEWKERRSIVQAELTRPTAASSYYPLLADPVARISESAPAYAHALDDYTPLAAMDMFFSVTVGFDPGASQGPGIAADEDVTFARRTQSAFQTMARAMLDRRVEGDPDAYASFKDDMDFVTERTLVYLEKMEKMAETDRRANVEPYFSRLAKDSRLSRAQFVESVLTFLQAGVDTTHHVLLLLLLNLAENPHHQATLREELQRELGDRPVAADDMKRLPFLSACIRESHRKTPPGVTVTYRAWETDSEVGGYSVPANTKIFFATYPAQNNPDLLQGDPSTFDPTRWLKDNVKARKGTPREALDNKLLSHPFGFGPRMCLGFRVADAEIRALTAQLVRDWEFELDPIGQDYALVQQLLISPMPFPKLKFTRATRAS